MWESVQTLEEEDSKGQRKMGKSNAIDCLTCCGLSGTPQYGGNARCKEEECRKCRARGELEVYGRVMKRWIWI